MEQLCSEAQQSHTNTGYSAEERQKSTRRRKCVSKRTQGSTTRAPHTRAITYSLGISTTAERRAGHTQRRFSPDRTGPGTEQTARTMKPQAKTEKSFQLPWPTTTVKYLEIIQKNHKQLNIQCGAKNGAAKV